MQGVMGHFPKIPLRQSSRTFNAKKSAIILFCAKQDSQAIVELTFQCEGENKQLTQNN